MYIAKCRLNCIDNSTEKSHYTRLSWLDSLFRRAILANTAQSRKRARQAEKRRQGNAGYRSMFRTFIKNLLAAIDSGDKAKAQEAYKEVTAVIDKTANKGLIHRNKASNQKARLNARVKAMS